ncbi:auxilin-like protein 1 [Impatiens glandulifera]|uniref:auxilin-like protein 1 n=1 Tax=Impatiens glandulifera TaxID=253017 RepID=UPI001FB13644|nr:auxilin-like protein 1 [Impatiens glandulifera]
MANISRKPYNNNNGLTSRTVYDDAFGGPQKFGVPTLSPRVEDYCEIFGGFHNSRASSIPFLDLPAVDDAQIVDVRSSDFDYSEVFGGFDSLDFAISYEELIRRSKSTAYDSSDEAWTPTPSEHLSKESGSPVYSEISQCLNAEINLSEELDNRMSHMDNLRATQKNERFMVTESLNDKGVKGGAKEGRQIRKTLSHPAGRSVERWNSGNYVEPPINSVTADSHSSAAFITISDINLKTQPSQVPPPLRPPPALAMKDGKSNRQKAKLKSSKSYAFERTMDEGSPPYFDVEMDASSSAADRDGMETTREKLKSAKELKERDYHQSRPKRGLKVDYKVKQERRSKTSDGSFEDEGMQRISQSELNGAEAFLVEERQHDTIKRKPVVSESAEHEKHINMAKSAVKKHGKERKSSPELRRTQGGTAAWIEEAQFFEVTENDKSRRIIGHVKDENPLIQMHSYNYEQEIAASEFYRKRDHRRKTKTEKVTGELDQNLGRSKGSKEMSRPREREKKETIGHTALRQEGENKSSVVCQNDEIMKKDDECAEFDYLIEIKQNGPELEAKHKNDEMKRPEDFKRRPESPKRFGEAVDREKHESRIKNSVQQFEAQKNTEEDITQEGKRKQQIKVGRDVNEGMLNVTSEREETLNSQSSTLLSKTIVRGLDVLGSKLQEEEVELANLSKDCKNEKTVDESKETGKGVIEESSGGLENEEKLKWFSEEGHQVKNQKEVCLVKEEVTLTEARKSEEILNVEEKKEQSKNPSEDIETQIIEDNKGEIMGELTRAHVLEEPKGLGDNQDQTETTNQMFDEILEQRPEPCKADTENLQLNPEALENEDEKNIKVEVTNWDLSSDDDGTMATELDSEDHWVAVEVINVHCEERFISPALAHNNAMLENKKVKESVQARTIVGQKAPEIATNSEKVNAHMRVFNKEDGRKIGTEKSIMSEGKSNTDNSFMSGDRAKDERIKREKELERDRLKKMEEEKEREREREKDLMAVNRATLEARDRALNESRDRTAVEKATAEARQRAMVEARERLERASAEARERLLPEKASMEARLRAERTAVERATAEARERAFQKTMADKSAFEAKRSISDKHSVNNSVESRDTQFQAVGSSYAESPQRCKARLERHQRTAQRAAKALAEKNMRDLIAQKEQAERNRLAESLDADVKRWSNGKEGNLRALLSTLQYILGQESGWQPIPLTEVITSVAVKKAYRKATLCVHPDKLQQRGASIHQKYICEKVFDLLKEAWNKFNSEER